MLACYGTRYKCIMKHPVQTISISSDFETFEDILVYLHLVLCFPDLYLVYLPVVSV